MLASIKRLAAGFYSDRQAKPLERYSYAFSEKVRLRIVHALRQHRDQWMTGGRFDFTMLLHEVGEMAIAKYGCLRTGPTDAHPVVAHFAGCSDEEVLEFIEMCFQANTMGHDSEGARAAVDRINRIFEEEALGYELTPPRTVDTGTPAEIFGRPTGRNLLRTVYPQIVKKNDRTVHETVVQPALEVLADSRLATANSELLKAFEEVRKGDYADAITSCGASFESVLKTICDFKVWAYDKNRDTCSSLVEICRAQGLFPTYYSEMLKGVGIVRNNLGDAHGKGPAPERSATREEAEHLIAITCAHATLLVRKAGF
jgi:hypothetical protein